MERGKKNASYTVKKRPKKQNDFLEEEFCGKSLEGISTAVSSHSDILEPYFSHCPTGLDSMYGNDQETLYLDSLSLENINFMAKTKAGSKRLQQFIAKSRPEEIEKIVSAVAPHMGELMVDLYGNYMCQTLVQSCSSSQRLAILRGMKDDIINIARNSRGTHALQNLISIANLAEEEALYQQCFSGHILVLSKDINSSHVIQRLLVTVKNKYFIIKEILGKVRELAMDKLGLCVIKKCIKDPQIFTEILEHCLVLMQDPYGNYAVQNVLETWKEECAFEFISSIQSKTAQLCIQKYASNVMEKAMKVENIRQAIIKELISENKLDLLLGSPYGCYVLRTAAFESDRNSKIELSAAILSATPKLHNAKLQAQWDEIMSNLR
jgi:Pumilio-family RNA binding repeat